MTFFQTCDNYKSTFEFYLTRLLYELYSVRITSSDEKVVKLDTALSFTELINGVLQSYDQQPSRTIYAELFKFLNELQEAGRAQQFEDNSRITQQDYMDAVQYNETIDSESAFETISKNIQFLFVVTMVAEIIPEFSIEKASVRWRNRACRNLCEIYTDEYASYTISEKEKLDKNEMIQQEKAVAEKKADLFKSFMMMIKAETAEEIMSKRLSLLDQAKAISPEDIPFLEECSDIILERLKNSKEYDFSSTEERIRLSLGVDRSQLLSDDVIHTLATAEFLFLQYANDKYAMQGFDFSSISALYYQAFENAFNELLWTKYARFLNNLNIDGMMYTDILQERHDDVIRRSDLGFGFLPSKARDRAKYTIFNRSNETTVVGKTCMYGSFVLFLGGHIKEKVGYSEKDIPCFYEWLSRQLKFKDAESMLKDTLFMKEFYLLRNEMSAAADYRNNASHGGSEIDISQCRTDRKIVLSDLQEARMLSMGLVRRLLNLLTYLPERNGLK